MSAYPFWRPDAAYVRCRQHRTTKSIAPGFNRDPLHTDTKDFLYISQHRAQLQRLPSHSRASSGSGIVASPAAAAPPPPSGGAFTAAPPQAGAAPKSPGAPSIRAAASASHAAAASDPRQRQLLPRLRRGRSAHGSPGLDSGAAGPTSDLPPWALPEPSPPTRPPPPSQPLSPRSALPACCPPASPPGPPSGPMDPRALLHAIRTAGDLDVLSPLLRNHALDMNVRHLDAALDRLGRLAAAALEGCGGGGGGVEAAAAAAAASAAAAARAEGARLLSVVLPARPGSAGGSPSSASGDGLAAAPDLSPRDCASLMSALARLHLVPSAAVAATLQGALLAQLADASLRDVAQMLHGCVRLRLELQEGSLPRLLRRLEEAQLAAAGKPQDISMVLWSLASLEEPAAAATAAANAALRAVPGDWVSCRLLPRLAPYRLFDFSPQALSNSAWALARLGCRPGDGWLGALVEASGRQLQAFKTAELVNLLWALAVLRHRPTGPWLARALGRLREAAAGMSPQDVSSLCWSLAVLRVRPGLPLLHRLVARALALRRRMPPQELITTLWGLSRLGVQLPERAVALLLQGGLGAVALYGHSPPEAGPSGGTGGGSPAASARDNTDAAAAQGRTAAGAGSQQRVVMVGPGDLAGAALVLASCRHVPPRRWLVRFCAAVSRQLRQFGPREISTLLYGIGRLGAMGVRLDPHWLDRLLAEAERLAAGPGLAVHAVQSPGSQVLHHPSLRQQPRHGRDVGGQASSSSSAAAAAAAAAESQRPGRLPQPQAQAQRLDAAQMAVVLWAVARLGHRPPRAWVAEMARLAAARAEEFGPREAAATIRALQDLEALVSASPYQARRAHVVQHTAVGGGGGAAGAGRERSGSRGVTSTCPMGRLRNSRRGRRVGRGSSSSTTKVYSTIDGSMISSSSSSSGSGGSHGSSSVCGEAVSELVARLAGLLPERSLYGALRSASLARGGMSYATVADHLLTDMYGIKSLGLLRDGGTDAGRAGGGGGAAAAAGAGGSGETQYL